MTLGSGGEDFAEAPTRTDAGKFLGVGGKLAFCLAGFSLETGRSGGSLESNMAAIERPGKLKRFEPP